MSAAKEQAVEYSRELVTELQGWHLAKERAARQNRNLLQYGAGIAACLGILTGSGGVLSLANALAQQSQRSLSGWSIPILAVVSIVALGIVVVLAFLLLRAFGLREVAEHDADAHLQKLVAQVPSHFLPPTAG